MSDTEAGLETETVPATEIGDWEIVSTDDQIVATNKVTKIKVVLRLSSSNIPSESLGCILVAAPSGISQYFVIGVHPPDKEAKTATLYTYDADFKFISTTKIPIGPPQNPFLKLTGKKSPVAVLTRMDRMSPRCGTWVADRILALVFKSGRILRVDLNKGRWTHAVCSLEAPVKCVGTAKNTENAIMIVTDKKKKKTQPQQQDQDVAQPVIFHLSACS